MLQYPEKLKRRLVGMVVGPFARMAELLDLPDQAAEALLVEALGTILSNRRLPDDDRLWVACVVGVARQLLVRDRILAEAALRPRGADEPLVLDPEDDLVSAPEVQRHMNNLDATLLRRLYSLESDELAPFWAFYAEGKGVDEVAAQFGVSPKEAEGKLRTLRRQFDEFIHQQQQTIREEMRV